jgi:hypothetical protein
LDTRHHMMGILYVAGYDELHHLLVSTLEVNYSNNSDTSTFH